MATRNLTRKFKTLREGFSNRRRPRSSFRADRSASGDHTLLADGGAGASFEEARNTLPPRWVDAVDEVNDTVRRIEGQIDRLHEVHKPVLAARCWMGG